MMLPILYVIFQYFFLFFTFFQFLFQVELTSIDNFLITAHSNGVTPVLLFEYYQGFSNPVGPYSKWYNIG